MKTRQGQSFFFKFRQEIFEVFAEAFELPISGPQPATISDIA